MSTTEARTLTPEQVTRYSRHIIMPRWAARGSGS